MLAKRGALLAVGFMALVPLSPGDSRTTRVVGVRGGPDPASPQAQYAPSSKEFWLTADQFDYIRPGFHITVNSVTIPADGRAVADLSFTDDGNQPLDRLGQVTPGALSVSLVLAWWDAGARQYTAYTTRSQKSPITGVTATQAGSDSGGTWTDLAIGHSTYRFKTAVPAGYDTTKTHTLAIYATRATADILGKDYYANAEFDFRPDAAAVSETWDMIANTACNTCHNPLSAHGGSRQDVKLCVTCHSPQTTDPDTGNTVDFKVMVHKIHMGENLPSVQAGTPYQIIGFQQGVNDFSTVAFPKDIRNCTTCHAAPATQASNWFTYPNRAACQSCHDDVNFTTGENHPGGPQADDTQCASCHHPQGDRDFDASVMGAHTVPYRAAQLKGLNAQILSVTNAKPGQKPTVTFQLTQNDGSAVDPSTFGSNLNLLMGGPTVDYAVNPFRERADGSNFNGSVATYTFNNAIPAGATGTWAFSIEARRTVTLDPPAPEGPNFTEAAFNPVFYASVDGSALTARRQVVDLANCNKCHDRLALHGGQRLNTEECVMCHNPNASDVSRRPADQLPVESIDFKRMIHRIHTGENLTQPQAFGSDCAANPTAQGCFTIFGFFIPPNPPNPVNFNEIRFPGDRRDCEKCHLAGTEDVVATPPIGWLATATPRDWYTPMLHHAAACLGCHDTQAAAAHAFLNTAPFGEACAVCHGPGAEQDVEKVHAR